MTTSMSLADLTGDYGLDPNHTAVTFLARHWSPTALVTDQVTIEIEVSAITRKN